MGTKRVKLLDLLHKKYPRISRKELHARTVCGEVYVNGERIREPNRLVDPDAEPAVHRSPYVSRGGEKLEGALRIWGLPVEDKTFLDAGSSTGGFTDCLLKYGAKAVHAVDVGYNQIAFSLRRDSRVILHERTNLMDLVRLDPPPHAAVADLSFRSIVGAAGRLLGLTLERWAVILIKPQFEYAAAPQNGSDEFTGVLEDPKLLADIIAETVRGLEDRGIEVVRLLESPIRGRKGNREFLALIGRDPADSGTENTCSDSGTVSGARAYAPAEIISRLYGEADSTKEV